MDLDIQFGELEESEPGLHRRPDRNKHYAVVAFQSPVDEELPIFVDLDVLRDMETHAQSDTSVELGGVMLGGQFEDEDGNPFVVVTDSLRAQHYEATKGSFKFTHDTWEQISRERDEFPEELQMVGWYHTHPDWGVFLSGMDMFICDHFFNKPLDIALVIDPCRGDRGMFQWTGDPGQRVRRTGGFYLISSRFRQGELDLFAAQLEGKSTMTNDPRFRGVAAQIGPLPAPVVNIAEQRNPWQGPAIMGMLTIQFLVLSLIAWKLLLPPATATQPDDKQAKQIAAIEDKVDKIIAADYSAARTEAQARVLNALVSQLQGVPSGLVQSYEDQQVKLQRMEGDLDGQHALNEKLTKERVALAKELQEKTDVLASKDKRIDELNQIIVANKKTEGEIKHELALLKKQLGEGDAEAVTGGWFNWTTIGVTTGVVLLLVAAGVAAAVLMRREDGAEGEYSDLPEQRPEDTNKKDES